MSIQATCLETMKSSRLVAIVCVCVCLIPAQASPWQPLPGLFFGNLIRRCSRLRTEPGTHSLRPKKHNKYGMSIAVLVNKSLHATSLS